MTGAFVFQVCLPSILQRCYIDNHGQPIIPRGRADGLTRQQTEWAQKETIYTHFSNWATHTLTSATEKHVQIMRVLVYRSILTMPVAIIKIVFVILWGHLGARRSMVYLILVQKNIVRSYHHGCPNVPELVRRYHTPNKTGILSLVSYL